MRIYVASSWRNNIQPHVVQTLRAHGLRVYDFKNPAPDNQGFHWKSIRVSGDEPAQGPRAGQVTDWRDWTPGQFREALDSDIAKAGFQLDMDALNDCEACVLVLSCGKSAHLELGQAVGAGKRTIVFMPNPSEPELMYKMCDHLCLSMGEVLAALALGPKYALPPYAQSDIEALRSHMHSHAEHAGLPAPTEQTIQDTYISRFGTNAIYGKFGTKKPSVWYGPGDRG